MGQTVVDPDLLDRGVVEVLLRRPEPLVLDDADGVHAGSPMDPTGSGSVTTQIGPANRGPGDPVDDRSPVDRADGGIARSGSIPGCACCSRSSIRGGRRCRSTSRSRPRPDAAGHVRDGLLGAVGRHDGLLYAGERQLSDDDALGEPPLLEGAVLTVDRPGLAEPRGLLELHVVAGPDSGAVHRLPPGEHGIGRSVEATIRIDDPDVSRLHAVLRVATDGSSTARCTTSHPPTARPWTTSPSVAPAGPFSPGRCCGSATPGCAWRMPEVVPVSCRPDGAGHLEVNRPPRHVRPQCPCASRCRRSRRHASAAASR